MNDTGKKIPNLDLVYGLAKDKLQFQSEQWNAIDQKNAIVLAVYGIFLAMLISIDVKEHWACQRIIQVIGLLIWLTFIVIGMANSLISLMPKTLDMPPNISKLSEKYLGKGNYDTKNSLLSRFEESIKENDLIIAKKTKCLEKSIKIYLPISLFITILVVIFKLAFGGTQYG